MTDFLIVSSSCGHNLGCFWKSRTSLTEAKLKSINPMFLGVALGVTVECHGVDVKIYGLLSLYFD